MALATNGQMALATKERLQRLWWHCILTEFRYQIGYSGQVLVLSRVVIEHFNDHRQHSVGRSEAGGQLFATFSEQDVQVTHATGPRSTDKRSMFRFVPNRLAERREIKALFRSGLHYVGDWHTHPQRAAIPSGTDIASMTETFRRSRHGLAGFIMIIVGTLPAPDGLCVAVCDGDNCEQLTLIQS
jgi:integrative and conjugative element protein (TIGR02256 family)